MTTATIKWLTNLQLFAEGAGASGGDGGVGSGTGTTASAESSLATSTKGVKNPLANVQYGKQDVQTTNAQLPAESTQISAEDRQAKFEELIKGEYKDLYDARMQDTIQKRLKSSKETVDRYNALTPTLEMLGKKYGVDATDVEALNKAIQDDDSYYEEEAMQKGISVEQLKEIRKVERENESLREQMRQQTIQQDADRIYASWMDQSANLKNVYPGFDLNAELQNQRFVDLLKNNIDVRTAYEVIHKDEIIPAAMQFTANQVKANMARSMQANQNRPVENGISSNSSAVVKSDVSQLSKADRAEIIRRVARGEKIRF